MFALTRCVCKNNPFIYLIYANHNLVAQSGYGFAEPYRRADMRVCPYDFHKFSGAKRERLCEYAANGSHDLVAQAVVIAQGFKMGRGELACSP